ncbi:MAG: Xaa-Pro peptidase family protein [Rhodovibrionaceae bacterium]
MNRLEALSESIDQVALRAYRLKRVQERLRQEDCAAAVLFDPINIRYATGSRNMAVWTLHNHVRYAFVPAEGLPVLFEFGAGRLATPAEALETVGEVRPPRGWTYFYSGDKKPEHVQLWAAELAGLLRETGGGNRRVAFDHLDPLGLHALQAQQVTVTDGEALMERARLIKSAEEIACIKLAIAVAELGMARMRTALRPGLSENALWSILHQTNIEHDGEWIETRLLSSGPRTNPWMQESSPRAIEAGDLVAFDTDMIGPNGYCADISRTYLCGGGPASPEQKALYAASAEQLAHNFEQLKPGRSFREVVESEWSFPQRYLHSRYGFAHGVGMADEFPFLPNRAVIDRLSNPDDIVEPGMVFSIESYIGEVGGKEGVKLEDQLLITESGPELLSHFPLEDSLR